jgi:hypothetical protein
LSKLKEQCPVSIKHIAQKYSPAKAKSIYRVVYSQGIYNYTRTLVSFLDDGITMVKGVIAQVPIERKIRWREYEIIFNENIRKHLIFE